MDARRRRRTAIGIGLLGLIAALVVLWSRVDLDRRAASATQADTKEPDLVRVGDRESEPRAASVARLTGRVIDERSKAGIADASVCVHALGEVEIERAMTPICVVTDEGGSFELFGLLPGNYEVHAVAREHLPGSAAAPVVLRGDGEAHVELALAPGGVALRGRTEDIAGGPIEHAAISLVVPSRSWGPTVMTDPEGRFEIWVPAGRQQVVAVAAGYALASVTLRAPGPEQVIRLMPEASIEGRVVDASSGAPIAGARVTARLFPGARQFGTGSQAWSDAEGRFRLSRLHPGRYQVLARSDDLYGTAAASVLVGLGEQVTGVVIAARREPYVRGRVVVHGRDEVCPGGRVSLFDAQAGTRWNGPIDDAGNVRVLVPASGTYAVEIDCPGYVGRDDYPPITVADEAPSEQVWAVDVGLSIRGVVVDARGSAIAGASVSASPRQTSTIPARTVETDADGSFELGGLGPGEHGLRASAEGFAEPTADVLASAPSDGVELTLVRGGEVFGVVVDSDGQPVADVDIGLDGASAGIHSDGSGEFELHEVAPGVRRIDARDSGTGVLANVDEQPAEVQVEVGDGERVEVRLEIAARNGRIRGRVLDASGEPVSNALVVARPERGDPELALRAVHAPTSIHDAVLTESDGRFEIAGLEPGSHTIRAQVRGGDDAIATKVEPGAEVDLVLSGTGSVLGTIVVADGEPPPSFWVSIRAPDTGAAHSELVRHPDGEFRLDAIKAGPHRVFVRATEGQGHADVDIRPGELTRVVIELSTHGELVGRVVSADDRTAIAGVRVTARATAGGLFTATICSDLSNISDSDGRFRVPGVSSGRVTVHLVPKQAGRLHPDWHQAHITVDVAAGGVTDLGTVELLAREVGEDEARGELGFEVQRWDHLGDQAAQQIIVASVTPGGPAQLAGLAVGDHIVRVGEHDVTQNGTYLYFAATQVAPGQVVTLTLDDLRVVAIRAR